ncbi:hypothetical protein [Clostridium estertheticum]|uniref:hypothetical protein n=1 Tax=Clostridium estertheticum TaxID=238834 RepID=UPI001C0AECC5|nr:hypothetical protein [Clostridium estertheticum]MBU3186592.1 hypothetical protein [Clostridium estertheticum]
MSESVGIDKVVKFLESEKKRFLRAGLSGEFCDSEKCLKTACTIGFAIDETNKIREKLDL